MALSIRILTPTGMCGYSFSEHLFWQAVENRVDAVILDSGSTDSGPSKLALGTTTVSREAYERDLGVLVAACHSHRVPLLIGSAGGDGSDAHVDLFIEIITKIITERGYRPMKIITIKAEISKEVVMSQFQTNQILPCGPAVPPLTQSDITDATRIVGQMGHEPWLKAMECHSDFDIIIGGRSYDPAPYAAFCVFKGFGDLGLAYHMGKIMECGGVCAMPKSSEALATIRKDSFDIRPLDPDAKCTSVSVAAHTLYEKTRPDHLVGPGGTLDVSKAKYEELSDGQSVRVRGAVFHPLKKGDYTVKLEGAKVNGYLAAFVGGISDPILGSQIDSLLSRVEAKLREMNSSSFDIQFRVYGRDHVIPGSISPTTDDTMALGHGRISSPRELGLLCQVRAETQQQAKHIAGMARIFVTHGPYPGQLATAGNFAMPFSPFEIALGPIAEFCVYHLMKADPLELFPVSAKIVDGSGSSHKAATDKLSGDMTKTEQTSLGKLVHQRVTLESGVKHELPGPHPPPTHVYLANIASVIRSKNAGPYELTIDVMFPSMDVYSAVKSSSVLTREAVKTLYGVQDGDIIACLWWDPALAFKLTMRRRHPSASFEDQDVHGSTQHVPLMYLPIPWLQS